MVIATEEYAHRTCWHNGLLESEAYRPVPATIPEHVLIDRLRPRAWDLLRLLALALPLLWKDYPGLYAEIEAFVLAFCNATRIRPEHLVAGHTLILAAAVATAPAENLVEGYRFLPTVFPTIDAGRFPVTHDLIEAFISEIEGDNPQMTQMAADSKSSA